MEDDTLVLWEENILEIENEPNPNLFEYDIPNSSTNSILLFLKSKNFPSKMKTIFWRLVFIFISKIEEKINITNFETLVSDVLSDFTTNTNLIDKLKLRSISVLNTLENKNPLYDQLRSYNIQNDNKRGIRYLTDEQKLLCQTITMEGVFQYPPPKIELFLQCCDFSLPSKIKLAMLSVISETGYSEFRVKVKEEIEKLRTLERENPPLIHNNFNSCFLDNVEYLTRFTYGTLYNQFYLRDIKNFVDQVCST